mmetsp:Transcript_16465/g.44991  ORF Transcript_16465/g.44991 Transcript_16465/m.44991 type:complete len:99 (-) Transcript_16465:136-432(-)|eukprot:CAMPEP_0117498610 /NCGR_PEP_ID=MMETSP0784-20121206/21804_1 /TAXON_ID=39447 /ORGANISM="" /LENGTH=98 /DNA_ID=CAMNT_0005293703 /DNA_START=59 /DNA_END=355 /DNA_ORIENTATION=+
MVCACQWGISGIFLGAFVLAAAGVFTAIPMYLDLFKYDWYYMLCIGWACLGAALFVFGCFYELCIKSKPFAREAQYMDVNGVDSEAGVAPAPYVMITA